MIVEGSYKKYFYIFTLAILRRTFVPSAAIREDLLHHSEGAYQRHSFLQEDFIPFLQDDNSPHVNREALQEDISPPPYPDDLVLSVLKSPLNHSSAYNVVKESECTGCASNEDYCQDNERDDER